MTVYAYPGAQNVFVPNHEASGKMVVDFSRNINDFAVNRYAQIVPVKQTNGLYHSMTVEEAGRVINNDGVELVWDDGNDAPTGTDGTESHTYLPYRTKRYAPSARLGDMTIQQATWDIVAKHSAIKAQQMMTTRTMLAIAAATTAGNYDNSHVLTVGSISGNVGNWAQSTTARQNIKRSLNVAAEVILDDTLAAVKLEDLKLVISSSLARQISECQEIVDYIKGNPDALAAIKGDGPFKSRNSMYGLPDQLYGFPIEIEKTRRVTSRKGATKAVSSVLAAATPFMCSRPGGLVGVADAPSFSTLTVFVYDQYDMVVETWNDINNKRQVIRVVHMEDQKVTAPSSGVLFQAAA